MYSMAALPSSVRAAPAKKRRLSAPAATSSSAICARGWPVLRYWASTSSSECASSASASLRSSSWRSPGVVLRQVFAAVAAAWKAASTSCSSETGETATVVPSAGFTTSMVCCPCADTNRPSM